MQQRVINYLNTSTRKGAYALMSNRDVGDAYFERRIGTNELVYFDVTYTAGRRKKNADGSHSAKKAREILMIGKK
jgi:DNA adenine methylase